MYLYILGLELTFLRTHIACVQRSMQKDSHHRVVSANKGVYNQWRSHCINYNIMHLYEHQRYVLLL